MSDSGEDGVGQREVAYRLFAAEFEDADRSHSEGDDDRSPNYVITPTGARVNRLFAVGVLTEVEQVSEGVVRGRVVDPTGAFVTYAGQYQPDVQAFLERAETPTFVAMTGKARTFQPEDSAVVYTSVRPESINEVGAETRDRWTVQATEQTLARISQMASALTLDLRGEALEERLLEEGVDEGLATGIVLALDHYGTTPTYLDAVRDMALDAARVVAGERDEVGALDVEPDETGSATADSLVDSAVDVAVPSETGAEAGTDDGETVTSRESADDPGERAVGASEEPGSPAGQPEATATEAADTGAPATHGSDTPEAAEESTDTGVTAGEDRSQAASDSADELGAFDPEEFELDDETRQQVEEEYGTEFQTGTEVDEPGEADLETPDVTAESESTAEPADAETADGSRAGGPRDGDSPADRAAETAAASAGETAAEGSGDSQTETEESDSADAGADEPADLQAAVVELMAELDDGDGADRDRLVSEMADRHGVDADRTDEAIQDALMSGECYEPGDGRLKPI